MLRWLTSSRQSPDNAPRLVAHAPERGLRRPIAAAATCGATCCTSTCSTAHTIGGLIGAFVGGAHVLRRELPPDAAHASQSALTAYGFIAAGLSLMVFVAAGPLWLVYVLPAVQLVASLIAFAFAWFLTPRQPALEAIYILTGRTLIGAVIGALIVAAVVLPFL